MKGSWQGQEVYAIKIVACVHNPLPSVKIWEGAPSPIEAQAGINRRDEI